MLALQTELNGDATDRQATQARLERLQVRTGFGAVSGPGVQVTREQRAGQRGHRAGARLRPHAADRRAVGRRRRGDQRQRPAADGAQRVPQRRASRSCVNIAAAQPAVRRSTWSATRTRCPPTLLSSSIGEKWYALKDSLGFRFDVRNGGTMTLPAAPRARLRSAEVATPNDRTHTHARGQRVMIAALGLLVGVVLGLIFTPDVPAGLDPYLPIAVVAALDAVFGALRAYLEGIFDDKVFVVSFFSNVVIAAAIVYLGDKLGRRRTAVDRRHRRARHPDLLQRRRRSGGTCSMPEEPESQQDPDRGAARTPSEAQDRRRGRPATAPRGAVPAVAGPAGRRRAARRARLRGDHPGAHQQHRQQLRRVPRGGPGRRPLRPGRHLPARPERDQRARVDPARSSSRAGRRRAPRSRPRRSRPRSSASSPARCPVTGPGIRLTVTEGPRPRRRRLRARHHRGAAVRRRRGDAGQRRGAAGGPERRRGRHRAGSGSTAAGDLAVRLRRDRRPAHARAAPSTWSTDRSPSSRTRTPTVDLVERDSLDITSVRQPTPPQFAQPQ